MWRKIYDQNPHLRHLTVEQLRVHCWDLINNSIVIDFDGRISYDIAGDPDAIWMQRFTGILEELNRRGLDQTAFASAALTSAQKRIAQIANHPAKDRVVARLKSFPPPRDPCFVRYGHRKFIEPTYGAGQIYVSPAADFNDPSLNTAIADDELSAEFYPAPNPITIQKVSRTGKLVTTKITPTATTIRHSYTSNYLICCFSQLLNPRMFLDFDYDACIVIRDVATFNKRVMEATKTQLPDFKLFAMPVQYYQPSIAPFGSIWVPIAKSISFAYQREFRLLWIPDKPTLKLNPLKLKLGDFSDIADLILI